MSDGALASAGSHPLIEQAAGWRRNWLGMDKNPRVVAFAQTSAGIVAMHALFLAVLAAGLQVSRLGFAVVTAALIGCALFPAQRRLVTAAVGLAYLAGQPFRTDGAKAFAVQLAADATGPLGQALALQLAAVLIVLAAAFVLLRLQPRNKGRLLERRPVLFLLLFQAALIAAALLVPHGAALRPVAWTAVLVFAGSLWFLAYALSDQRAGEPTPVPRRLGFLRPFWGGSSLPFGKGPRFLAKFEARDEAALAVSRLKALKLLVWSVILAGLHQLFLLALRDAGVPTFHHVLADWMHGLQVHVLIGWGSVLANFVLGLFEIAVWGHTIVAIARMAGYAIPRNMARPLESRTVAEFWNRYFFYFKELLVDFFFFPTFTRFLKKSPKLRLAFATFIAAAVGNFIYHFLYTIHAVGMFGLVGALARLETYAFYCCVLAAGIIVSQWRGRKHKAEEGFLRWTVLPRLNVLAFFCILKLFDDTEGLGSVADRFAILAHLIGVR